ncbi:MAG: aminoacyl-tRNA hydrolase [Candidatus Doudnabacteria bacterium]|nr:aminoacyl-tRNA hydrolase [Candidatus Doudnabacteria bacterium]
MKLIVGLGNPGEKYKNTRHNAGFLAIDYILVDGDGLIDAKPSHEFKSEMFSVGRDGNKIIFLKPQTYMNDSGQALKVICNFYKMDLAKDLLVVHDDTDLPFGEIRMTDSSSSAGHNGVQSIIDNLGTQDFHRIRIGVESRTARQDLPTDVFVLQNFGGEELEKLQSEVFPKVKSEVEKFFKN